jgi:DNA-directed RNA polymerase I subunit RPA12
MLWCRESRSVRLGWYLAKYLTGCADTGSKVTVTQTKPSDFPSFLRQKLQSSVQAVEKHNLQTDSTVHETCPKCGREEVKYTNVQLRGADEGSTVIYLCDCGNS